MSRALFNIRLHTQQGDSRMTSALRQLIQVNDQGTILSNFRQWNPIFHYRNWKSQRYIELPISTPTTKSSGCINPRTSTTAPPKSVIVGTIEVGSRVRRSSGSRTRTRIFRIQNFRNQRSNEILPFCRDRQHSRYSKLDLFLPFQDSSCISSSPGRIVERVRRNCYATRNREADHRQPQSIKSIGICTCGDPGNIAIRTSYRTT